MSGLDNGGEVMPSYFDTDDTGRTFTLTFPWRRPLWMMNDRGHWAKKAEATKTMRTTAALMARQSRLPAGLHHVTVALTWVVKDRRRRDGGENLAPTYKALLDGLVDYGLVADDDPAHVTRGPSLILYAPEQIPHLELHITVDGPRSAAA